MSTSGFPAHAATSASDAAADTLQTILDDGVILCIRQTDADRAAAACDAVVAGGLRVLEITLTTPGAFALIERWADVPDVIVGAGTVRSKMDVRRVAKAGGRFALSPVCEPDVCRAAHDAGLAVIPGAATPTEIVRAHDVTGGPVKVFPSAALGGPAYLRAIRGPLPEIPLVPTSGPTAADLPAWFAAGAAAVGVGGDVLPPDWTPASAETAARAVRDAQRSARSTP